MCVLVYAAGVCGGVGDLSVSVVGECDVVTEVYCDSEL